MAARDRPAERGRRDAREAIGRHGAELRAARVSAGLSQRAVADAVGCSHTKVGKIERATQTEVDLTDVWAMLAVVGLRPRVAAYPAGTPLRDRAHAALLERAHRLLHPDWTWATEVPLPQPGDLRSWDAVARLGATRIAFEAETGPRDGQELQRRLALKRRDGGVDHVILVLADTRGNRDFLREYRAQLLTQFPLSGEVLLRALRDGHDPGDSGLLVL